MLEFRASTNPQEASMVITRVNAFSVAKVAAAASIFNLAAGMTGGIEVETRQP
jgi:hypothetical protein